MKNILENLRFFIRRREISLSFKLFRKPRPEFILEMRKTFLEEFAQKFPATDPSSWRIRTKQYVLKHCLVFIFAMLSLAGGGTMALADQPNVNPGHPLYGLKRAGENIRLAIASPARQPELNYQLAQKRMAEMEAVQADPAQEIARKNDNLKNLDADLQDNMDKVLDKADELDRINRDNSEQKSRLCQNILEAMERRKQIVSKNSDDSSDFARFKRTCGNED